MLTSYSFLTFKCPSFFSIFPQKTMFYSLRARQRRHSSFDSSKLRKTNILSVFIINKVMPVISLLKLDNLFVTNNTAVVPYYWVFFCIQSKSMLQHIAAQRGELVQKQHSRVSFQALQICEQPLKIQFVFLLFDCLIFSQIDNFNIAIV